MPFSENPIPNPNGLDGAKPNKQIPRRLFGLAGLATGVAGLLSKRDNKHETEPQSESLEAEYLKLAGDIYFNLDYIINIIKQHQNLNINIQTNTLEHQTNSNPRTLKTETQAELQMKAKQICDSFVALPIKNPHPKAWKKFVIPDQELTIADFDRLRELHDYYKTLANAVGMAMREINPLASTDADRISRIDFIPQIVETKNRKTQNPEVKLGVKTAITMKAGEKPPTYYFPKVQNKIYLQ